MPRGLPHTLRISDSTRFAAYFPLPSYVGGPPLPPLQLPERTAGDRDLLDLGAAFDDLGDLGVAQVALDRVVLGEAVGAVQLDGIVGGAGGGAGGEILGDQGVGRGVG